MSDSSKSPQFSPFLQGLIFSNLQGLLSLLVLRALISWLDSSARGADWSGYLLASNFVIVPFGMGFCAALFWRKSGRRPYVWCVPNFAVSLVGAAIVLGEGAICLVMASPLILVLQLLGAGLGFWAFDRMNYLSFSVWPALLLLMFADASTPRSFHTQAVTEFHSSATPQQLWKFVAQYPPIESEPNFWMWRMGLPYPLSVKGEAKVGARRDCQLSDGGEVGQKITRVERHRLLEFVDDKQPKHPEILNHFELKSGSIELVPHKGGTLIRATTRYRLDVYPTFYFNYHTSSVLHHAHWRILSWMDRCAREKR